MQSPGMNTSLRYQILSGIKTSTDIALLMDDPCSFHNQVSTIYSTSNGPFDIRNLSKWRLSIRILYERARAEDNVVLCHVVITGANDSKHTYR